MSNTTTTRNPMTPCYKSSSSSDTTIHHFDYQFNPNQSTFQSTQPTRSSSQESLNLNSAIWPLESNPHSIRSFVNVASPIQGLSPRTTLTSKNSTLFQLKYSRLVQPEDKDIFSLDRIIDGDIERIESRPKIEGRRWEDIGRALEYEKLSQSRDISYDEKLHGDSSLKVLSPLLVSILPLSPFTLAQSRDSSDRSSHIPPGRNLDYQVAKALYLSAPRTPSKSMIKPPSKCFKTSLRSPFKQPKVPPPPAPLLPTTTLLFPQIEQPLKTLDLNDFRDLKRAGQERSNDSSLPSTLSSSRNNFGILAPKDDVFLTSKIDASPPVDLTDSYKTVTLFENSISLPLQNSPSTKLISKLLRLSQDPQILFFSGFAFPPFWILSIFTPSNLDSINFDHQTTDKNLRRNEKIFVQSFLAKDLGGKELEEQAGIAELELIRNRRWKKASAMMLILYFITIVIIVAIEIFAGRR